MHDHYLISSIHERVKVIHRVSYIWLFINLMMTMVSGSDSGKSNGDVGEAQISYIYKTHYPFTRNWLDAEFIAGLCYNSLHLGPNKTIITTII